MKKSIAVSVFLVLALFLVVCGQASAEEMTPDVQTKGTGTSSTELVAGDGQGSAPKVGQGTSASRPAQTDDSLQSVDTTATNEPSSTSAETDTGTAMTVETANPGDSGTDDGLAAMVDGPTVSYVAHVQNVGWQGEVRNGATAGTSGRSLRVEALRIKVAGINASVEYRAHVQNVGWQPWVRDGATAGTSGRSLRVEAIEVKLTGEDAKLYDLEYRAHVQNVGWQPWVRNGATAGTSGRSLRVEALEIRVVRKPDVSVSYRAHVQNVGWQGEVRDGATAGTSGQSLRVEALTARVENTLGLSGGLVYEAHVQNVGWQGEVRNGATAGTSGRSLRVEAVRMRLTGQLADRYSVWYRSHVQNYGWLSWARDGADSGSTSFGLRVEAVQIRLLPKGASGPSNEGAASALACIAPATITYGAYVQGSGWMDAVSNGRTAGTTGKSLRVEGLRASVQEIAGCDGGVQLNAHVQNVGWMGWQDAGAGKPGSGLRMEALQVRLTGSLARSYDVWYRVHAEGYGWMGWTCNGGSAGSIMSGKRIEAVQMRLMGKGSAAPGSTAFPFAGEIRRPRMILVGDSRTWAMYGTLYGMPPADLYARDGHGDIWIARSAVGHSWLVSTASGRIDAHAGPDTAVVILLGVNDASGGRPWSNDLAIYGLGNAGDYIRTLNGKVNQWRAKGASVVYCSIMPVGAHTGVNSYTNRLGMTLSNTGNIAQWNSDMRRGLSSQVANLDTYGAIAGNYATIDGLHYDDATNRRIYNFLRASVTG